MTSHINAQSKYYLYSDGSRFPKINRSGFGGYILAENVFEKKDKLTFAEIAGKTLLEFSQEIKEEDQKHNFELWGIITGLELAAEVGIKKIVSRCDDKTLMLHINNCLKDASQLKNIWGNKQALVEKVLTLSAAFDEVEFEYVPRNENKYSDTLSRKYLMVLERNYLADHKKLLEKSKEYFIKNQTPPHSVYFYSDHMTFVPFEQNPFLVSQRKNKSQKEFRRSIAQEFDSHWELEAVYKKSWPGVSPNANYLKEIEGVLLKKFNPDTTNWEVVRSFLPSRPQITLGEALEIFTLSLDSIKETAQKPWVYSNIEKLTDVFHQKRPVSREIFEKFAALSRQLSMFDNVIYHRTPRDIELKIKAKFMKNKRPALSVESTLRLLKNTENSFKKNKYFGQLMGLMIKELLKQNKEVSELDKDKIKKQLLEKYPYANSNSVVGYAQPFVHIEEPTVLAKATPRRLSK